MAKRKYKMTAEHKSALQNGRKKALESKNGHATVGDHVVATAPRFRVRVISSQEGFHLGKFTIDTWGQLIDLLHNDYEGVHIEEVTVVSNT